MFEELKNEIIKEYKFLHNTNLKIIKNFVSTDGRKSSTYLASSNLNGFENFVIKTFNQYSKTKEKKDELIKEFTILKLLNQKKIAAPLVLSKIEPKKYLLMTYLEGENASKIAQKGYNLSILFEELGRVVGDIHTIEMKQFGDIISNNKLSWKEFTLGEENKLAIVKNILDEETFNESMKKLYKYEDLAEEESQKKPYLITHDLYLDNFIYNTTSKKATYIDYGIAMAGRPLFDLAKLYIWTFNEHQYPDQKDNFLRGYSKIHKLPKNYTEIINMYVIRECFGMIRFFSIMNDKSEISNSIKLLKSFLSEKSQI